MPTTSYQYYAGGQWRDAEGKAQFDQMARQALPSPLKQITTKNVSHLVKACAYSFPDQEPSQTAPIVSAGRMYLTTAHYTVAVDGADCHVIWSNTWTPREHEPLNTHRGAALADGKIIRGTNDAFCWRSTPKTGTRFGLSRSQIRRKVTSSACRPWFTAI
jgi:hypothetical protein